MFFCCSKLCTLLLFHDRFFEKKYLEIIMVTVHDVSELAVSYFILRYNFGLFRMVVVIIRHGRIGPIYLNWNLAYNSRCGQTGRAKIQSVLRRACCNSIHARLCRNPVSERNKKINLRSGRGLRQKIYPMCTFVDLHELHFQIKKKF